MRYLGLDLGSKTCGVSISDSTGFIASSLCTLRYTHEEELINEISNIVTSRKVDKIVLGLPLNLNGSFSTRCEKTVLFKEKIEKELNIEVIFQDERFSTTEAENILLQNKTKRKNRKKVIDTLAATIILETYLSRKEKNE